MSLVQQTEHLHCESIKRKAASADHKNNVKQQKPCKKEKLDGKMICRVCTNPAEIPITNKIGDTLIISAIRNVANISINEADDYPKYVCKLCLQELEISLKFKKKCELSDMMFRNAVLESSPRPTVKYDFSLMLHEISQNRIIKEENNDDDNTISNEDVPVFSPVNLYQDPSIVTEEIDKKLIKRSIKAKSDVNSNTQNHKFNLLEPSLELSDNSNFKSINTNYKLIKIKTRQTATKRHKCRRCDLKFDTKDEMQKHQKENGCIYRACPSCGKLVLNLTNHDRIVHARTNKYTCHQCGKIYYSSGSLANHMHKHIDKKDFFCDHCPYRAKRKSYLVCHMRVHTGEHRYLCSICPLKFTNFANFSKHQLVHFSKKFKCTKCSKLFRQEKHLKDHYDAAHLNIRYRCSVCGKYLNTRKKLLSHELRVHKREKHKLFEEVQRVVIGNDND